MKGVAFLAVLIFLCTAQDHDSVLLERVQSMTFFNGKMTRGRRVAPVKQIECVSGDACSHYTPEVINCRNLGKNDQNSIQWECKAELPDYYQLGQATVGCEGYTSASDPYILAGSCGVEYSMHLTEKGHRYLQRKSEPSRRIHVEPTIDPIIVAAAGITALSFTSLVILFLWIAVCMSCILASTTPTVVRHTTTTHVPQHHYAAPGIHTHHHSSSSYSSPLHSSDFGTGYAMGSLSERARQRVVETRVHREPEPERHRSPSPSPPRTKTSTAFGGTKNR